jgi:hypothetical protein
MPLLKFISIPLLCSASVFGQWPDSPNFNLQICGASGEQAISKIVATQDGGCYVSWFDNRDGGYDVYMQRLDALGNPMWANDGILIADRSYSWTMDFDLDIDSLGNAVVVYRKNISGGDGIVVSSVSESGKIRWHKTVQNAGTFVASPVVTAIDNEIVVGWISDADSKFQRLNSKGATQWFPLPTVSDPAGGSFEVADLHPSIDGSVIASFVQYTTFLGSKQLYAQRIGLQGNQVWSDSTAVMSNNSLQIGAYPDFVRDGNGGGMFTWYGVSPLQVYASHVLFDGSHGYGGSIQVASSSGNTQRVNPIGCRDGDEFVVFFRPQDNNQSNDGVAAQRLASDGTLLWGSAGVVLKPTSSSPQYGSFATAKTDQGVALFFAEATSFGNDVIDGVSLNQNGELQWSPAFASVASTPSGKSRIAASSTGDGILLAWQDDRNGTNDIYAQRVNSNGSLGVTTPCVGDINGDSVVGVVDLLSVIDMWGNCPAKGSCDADLDGDNFVGVGDLLTIIDLWGACN